MLAKEVEQKIYFIRGHKVMLDFDLAKLYKVGTGALNRAVIRNHARFPADFMIRLTKSEFENLICQIGISSWGGRRIIPYAFTEQGVAMLSGVLKSKRAIQVNIAIMRAFVKLREIITQNKELAGKLNELERKVGEHDEEIAAIFSAIKRLMAIEKQPKRKREIGFHVQYK